MNANNYIFSQSSILWIRNEQPCVYLYAIQLTNIISNMGATKAHIAPLTSDNQQLQVSMNT